MLGFPSSISISFGKLTFTWKTRPWFGTQDFPKQWEMNWPCAALTHSHSFCLGLTEFTGSDFPQCSLVAAPQWALWFWQTVQLYPLWNALQIFCMLVQLAENMESPPPPQKCPTSSLFTLQRFKWLQTELPETVVNSWHSKFPWSQLAYKKDFPFFPLKIMSSPGTVQMPQIRQIRDLFWPTNEKTSPSSPWGPQDWVTPYTRCQFLKRLHWFP